MVLGADYDIAEEDGEKRLSEGRIGQSVVGAFIPFRGIVREATGAAENDRTLRAAYTAGMARRAFLKGLGIGKGCAYPARPKTSGTK
jgi:molybdopterin synthase catalytic subunit